MIALEMLVQFSNHAALMTVFVLLVNGLTVKWSGRPWWYRRLCAGGLYVLSSATGMLGWLLWVRPVAAGWVIAAMLLATALGWAIGKGWIYSAKQALECKLRMLEQAGEVYHRQTAAAASASAISTNRLGACPAEAVAEIESAGQEQAAAQVEEALIGQDKAQVHAKEALSVQQKQAILLAQDAKQLSAAEYPIRLRHELAGALQRGEFQLLYQPQFETGTERIRGFEALLRWHHPELGSIPPDKFIPIAEETGWIVPIGEWVLREACRINLLLQETEGMTAVMCVNISAVQLQEASFADSVCLILQETGLSPEALELEITESMLILSWAAAADNLSRLQEYGVRIALDDFGTGYSSLSYLQRLPVHLVKIDRSFIHGIPHSLREKALVESVIHLVHQLGIGVLAEGIEKEEQLCCLRDISCDCVQGFLLGRPMDGQALSSYVQAYRERREPVLIS